MADFKFKKVIKFFIFSLTILQSFFAMAAKINYSDVAPIKCTNDDLKPIISFEQTGKSKDSLCMNVSVGNTYVLICDLKQKDTTFYGTGRTASGKKLVAEIDVLDGQAKINSIQHELKCDPLNTSGSSL